MQFDKIYRQTLSEDIIKYIENLIISGRIKPGDSFPSERSLSEMLGVSRPPVREALHSLKALGIIDIKKGGAYLKDDVSLFSDHMRVKSLLTNYPPQEVLEARVIIECETVSLACLRSCADDIAAIRAFNAEAAKYIHTDVEKFLESDFAFHVAIANASGNSILTEMLKTIRIMFFAINEFNVTSPGHLARSVAFHERIADAIEAGDSENAKKIMKEHVEGFTSGVNEFYRKQEEP